MASPHVTAFGEPTFVPFRRESLDDTVHGRFESQAARWPGRTAVWTAGGELTYAALDARANAIAHAVTDRRGGSQAPVGVLLEHDAPLLAAILGVLKAGVPYVALDPAHSADRLERVLTDSTAEVVVAERRTVELARKLVSGRQVVLADDHEEGKGPRIEVGPDDLAYVYYTSGTAGRPKGVMDTHRNVLHNVMRYTNGLSLSPADRLTLLQRPAFSGAVSSMFGALLNGAAVCPFDVGSQGPLLLAEWLDEAGVTIYHSVPAVFRQLARQRPRLPSLRAIRLEGDRASLRDVELFRNAFHDGCVLVNGLGLTEAGLVRRFVVDRTREVAGTSLPVGYEVDDMDVLLLGADGRPVSAGEVGEIAVRSRYLSPGYWRQPELTAARFLAAASNGDPRTYLTGDLGRILPGNCLECLGRSDFQVKVRGQRVELDVVEAAILADQAVDDAAVVAVAHGDELRTTAYVVAASRSEPSTSSLRRHLARTLPEGSLPSRFIFLQALPVNENGKVDLPALAASDARERPRLDEQYAPPRTTLEQLLADVWSELLGVERVGVRDPFEELGGDSLLAAELLARLEELLERPVPFSILLKARTVEDLAAALREETMSDPPIVEVAGDNGGKRPFVYVHGDYAGGGLYCSRLAAELGRPFYAVTPHGLHESTVPPTVEAMAAERVASLRTVLPSGPYLLGGHCQPGGLVALEMARLLEASGERVALAVIATTPRNTRFPFRLPARTTSMVVSAAGRAFALDEQRQADLFWRARSAVRRLGRGGPASHGHPASPAWIRALLTHVPRRYPRGVLLLWPAEEEIDPQAARRRWLRIGVTPDIRVVPGDHLTAVTTHLSELAAALRHALDEADQAVTATE